MSTPSTAEHYEDEEHDEHAAAAQVSDLPGKISRIFTELLRLRKLRGLPNFIGALDMPIIGAQKQEIHGNVRCRKSPWVDNGYRCLSTESADGAAA